MRTAIIIGIIVIAVAGLWWMSSNSPSNEANSNTNSNVENFAGTQLTMGELSKHDSASDCWLLIDSGVYDVTDFIDQHPGGSDRIIPNCGTDATQEFSTQGGEDTHTAEAEATLSTYYLGELGETI